MNASSKLPVDEQISALVDGDGDPSLLATLADDPHQRALWHSYHQIGDLLRSADLQPLAHEHSFATAVSQRLQRDAAPAPRLRRWSAALAAAAGVAATTALVLLRLPQAVPPQLAELGATLAPPPPGVMRAGWSAPAGGGATRGAGLMLADAAPGPDWDLYLQAHAQMAPSPLGAALPSLQSGEVDVWR